MDPKLFRPLLLLLPIGALFVWSLLSFAKTKTGLAFMQLIGAGLLVVVVATHICGALSLFSLMEWGAPHSAGHYLDLGSAILGVSLLSVVALLRLSNAKRRIQ